MLKIEDVLVNIPLRELIIRGTQAALLTAGIAASIGLADILVKQVRINIGVLSKEQLDAIRRSNEIK